MILGVPSNKLMIPCHIHRSSRPFFFFLFSSLYPSNSTVLVKLSSSLDLSDKKEDKAPAFVLLPGRKTNVSDDLSSCRNVARLV